MKESQDKKKTNCSLNDDSSKKYPCVLEHIDRKYLSHLEERKTPEDEAELHDFFSQPQEISACIRSEEV